jgi:hypothetical protein
MTFGGKNSGKIQLGTPKCRLIVVANRKLRLTIRKPFTPGGIDYK